MLETVPPPSTLPSSPEAERAVLAAVMLEPSLLPVISARLTAEDYYLERHRLVYQAMIDLQEDQVSIDLRTLQARLEIRSELEAAGGLAYLATLDADLPDLSRVDAYAEIVKERSIRRRLIQASTEIIRDCTEGGIDAHEALSKAERAILGLGEESIQRGFAQLSQVLEETVMELEDRPGSSLIGIPSGFRDFDRMTHG
ncbi:MAG: replicative DNA helicase, partial [Acidobacteria bacterium]|nr:replicative DNA helicase [Acidobacteriota bacterium]